MRWVLLLLVTPTFLRLQEPETIYTPADVCAQVWRDLQRFPLEQRRYLRYLSLYSYSADEREATRPIMRGHCHHISREPDLIPAELVIGTEGSLLRVNLLDYGWQADVWEKLADEDPWFHSQVINVVEKWRYWPGGRWRDGQYYAPNTFQYQVKAKEVKATDYAPWTRETPEQARRLADLESWTGSKVPVLRADWFFQQTAAAQGRKTNYYTMLGIKNEQDFQRLIGFSEQIAKDRKSKLRESVAESGVTLEPRALAVDEHVGGLYRRTFDFRYHQAKDRRNPLRILDADIEREASASEQYGRMANGFFATAAVNLEDKDHVLAAVVPQDIALNSRARTNDRNIHPNISCLECHDRSGVQELDSFIRNTLVPPLALTGADPEADRKRRREYLTRSIQEPISGERKPYEAAVKKATGLDFADYRVGYLDWWYQSEAPKITLAVAARDFGINEKELGAALLRKARETGSLDLVLASLLAGRSVPRRQYEESIPQLWTDWKQWSAKK